MNEQSESILRAMAVLRPITVTEMEQLFSHLGDCKSCIGALGKAGYLDSMYRPSLATLWSINSKGKRYLAQLNAAGGQIAGPREGIPKDPYTGEKPIQTRPGSDDFLKVPSRRGDEVKEWERPYLICAKVEPVGVRG